MAIKHINSAQAISKLTTGTDEQPNPPLLDIKGEALQILANFLGCSIDELPPPTR